MTSFDLLVIGAGPGGYVAAIRAAQLGLSVALAERDKVGGTCLNRGCIPTKALLHAGGLYREMRACERFGLSAGELGYDLGKMYQYKEDAAGELRDGVERLLKANGVALFQGTASVLPGNRAVIAHPDGSETGLSAKNILIATGSQPAVPPIPGAQLPNVVTSDGLLADPPKGKRLAVIGGGVIGVEFATVFSSLGFAVTVLEALPSLLAGMDREISQSVKLLLKKQGVESYTGASVQEIAEEDGALVCRFVQKDKPFSVAADTVLIAAGRRAYTEGLFGDGAAPAMERGRIQVNSRFETSIPHLYAIGDVTGGIQLAHAASAQGIAAVEGICGKTPSCDLSLVPACIYTEPEIAAVGMTEADAKAAGIPVKVGKFLMSANGRSVIGREERGFIKLVFRAEDEVLLGAQLMCGRATDLVGQLAQAAANGLTREQMGKAMAAHPTYYEAVAEAAESSIGEAIHIMPKGKR